MKLTKNLLTALIISATAMTATVAHADYDHDDRIEAQVYQDMNFDKNVQKATKILTKKGYQVVDVDADDYRGKPILDIEAYKNNAKYDIKMSYPDLRIIQEVRDWD